MLLASIISNWEANPLISLKKRLAGKQCVREKIRQMTRFRANFLVGELVGLCRVAFGCGGGVVPGEVVRLDCCRMLLTRKKV